MLLDIAGPEGWNMRDGATIIQRLVQPVGKRHTQGEFWRLKFFENLHLYLFCFLKSMSFKVIGCVFTYQHRFSPSIACLTFSRIYFFFINKHKEFILISIHPTCDIKLLRLFQINGTLNTIFAGMLKTIQKDQSVHRL